jgi:hypothetical protein
MAYVEHEDERYYPVWVKRRNEWRLRVHSVETGRIVRWETMYRLTLAINYVIHHNYYSEVTQAWGSREWLEDHQDEWEEELVSRVEEAVGYPREEWWFSGEPAKELEPYKEAEHVEPFTVEERSEYLGGK